MFSQVPDVSAAASTAADIVSIITRVPHVNSPAPSKKKDKVEPEKHTEGQIVFQNVQFSYPTRPGVRVIDDLTLTVPPRKKIAFVGPSGSGKSTM